MNWAFLAAVLRVPATSYLSATLTTTAAPSGGNVTSATVTVGVPPGNSGSLSFISFGFSGTVGTQTSKNGAAFAAVAENDTIVFANGDTLAVRITGASAGESWTFTLLDITRNVNLGTYTITAS